MGIIRDLFGPSKDEMWQQLATEINANFVDGGFWSGSKVLARTGVWTITLDTYTVSTGKTTMVFTRMRAPYINRDGFRFKVYRKSMFSGLGKMLGMQDVEIGEPQFDEEFIIKGNDELKLKKLFSYPKLRELLLSQREVNFEIKDDEGWFATNFPEGVDELVFQAAGVITDIGELKNLYEIFALILDQLCVIGSATKSDPQVDL